MFHVIEISSYGVALRKEHGHLVVCKEGEKSRVPLDDIAALIISGGTQLTSEVLKAVSKRGAPIVICDEAYLPCAMMLPCFQHHRTVENLENQIKATQPLQKQMWARIVREKILNQLKLLTDSGVEEGFCARIKRLADSVRSGDPDNKEAQAAILYWPKLFGEGFYRRPERPGLNGLLNYSYAVLRASTARAVSAVGLHPALGIFHRNRKNPFCLVDDLMEPFRVLADSVVYQQFLHRLNIEDLTPELKLELVKVLYMDQQTSRGTTPVFQCIRDLALSVCESYRKKSEVLVFPEWKLA